MMLEVRIINEHIVVVVAHAPSDYADIWKNEQFYDYLYF